MHEELITRNIKKLRKQQKITLQKLADLTHMPGEDIGFCCRQKNSIQILVFPDSFCILFRQDFEMIYMADAEFISQFDAADIMNLIGVNPHMVAGIHGMLD